MTQHFVVTYDISSDSRRRRLFRTLSRYGAWQQYSVFELRITGKQREALIEKTEQLLSPADGDRVQFYRVCESCSPSVILLGHRPTEKKQTVI